MKKLLTCILVFAMVFTFVACQPKQSGSGNSGGTQQQADKPVDSKPQEVPELTYWTELNANTAQVVKNLGETEYAKVLQGKTGIKVNYLHPPAGQADDAFSILIASADYPDIIEYKWIDYPGSPVSAIENGVIIELSEVFEKYSPNVTALLEKYPEIKKMIRTDEGHYYVYPFLRGTTQDNNPLVFSEGAAIRKDLLDKLGMSIPETPGEWYAMLKGFKDQLNVEIPITIRGTDHLNRLLAPGFDSWNDFYVDDGVVKHGLIEPNRLDYLTEARKWYEEGLLDSEFLVVDKNTQATKVMNSQVGATYAPGGSGMGTWIPAFQEIDPTVDFCSAPPMSPEKGRLAKFSRMNTIYGNSGPSAAISTACKNVEAAARLLDFSYGEEGHMLVNFGIEGVSYEMVNGNPEYTEVITDNPDGLSMTNAMSIYMRCHTNGAFIQDPRYIEQYYRLPQQQEALRMWTQTDMGKHLLPPVSATSAESEELAQIMNNINIYSKEMESKFITGVESLSKFDEYVEQLKAFNIERAIEIMQNCYDRYMAR